MATRKKAKKKTTTKKTAGKKSTGRTAKKNGKTATKKSTRKKTAKKRPGLWDNIHKKKERIAHGSGEKMRKKGAKGAPSKRSFRKAEAGSK